MSNENVWLSRDANDIRPSIPPYYTLLETNSDNNVLLGACNLGGSLWNGSLWFFENPEDAVSVRKGVGMEADTGASAAKFLSSGNQIIVADYAGHLWLINCQKAAPDCPTFFVRSGEFWGHDDFVTSVDVNASGTVLISGSMDDSVILWDIETSVMKQKYPHGNIVKTVAFQPEQDSVFVAAGQSGCAFLWDVRMEKPASVIVRDVTAFTSVEFISNIQGALGNVAGSLTLFDVRTKGITKYNICTGHGVRNIRANRSSNLLAAAVDDLTVRVFDCSEGTVKQRYESRSHQDFASGLSWLNNSRSLLSSGWDSKIFSHSVPDESEKPILLPESCSLPVESW